MKKSISSVVRLTLFLGLMCLTACIPKIEDASKLGNTNSNIANMGYSVTDRDWIYFSNQNDGGSLFKMKKDRTEESRISDDKAIFLNLMDDFIYFINNGDAKIYRIKPDGTERSLISDNPSNNLITDGDWLYAIDLSNPDDPAKTQRIYRSKLDGTERTVVSQAAVYMFNLVGDRIYYIDQEDFSVHRMKTDGTEDQAVGDVKAKIIMVAADKIYYIDSTKKKTNEMWSVGTDGTGAVRLSPDNTASFNVSGGWIYYSTSPKEKEKTLQFKRIKLDGTEPSVVNADQPTWINIHEELLVYASLDVPTLVLTQTIINTDGSGRKDYVGSVETSAPEPPYVGEPPNDEPTISKMGQIVIEQGMIIVVNSAYASNLRLSKDDGPPILSGPQNGINLFINFTLYNNAFYPMELKKKLGVLERIGEGPGMETSEIIYPVMLADITDKVEELEENRYLPAREYIQSWTLMPDDDMEFQAEVHLENPEFPVLLALIGDNGKDIDYIEITPDPVEIFLTQNEAIEKIEEKFTPVALDFMGMVEDKLEKDLQVFYSFRIEEEGKEPAYYLVDWKTGKVYTGELEGEEVFPIKLYE